MTEREIFLAALQQPTAGERAAFLDKECGSDANLRGQIEALLAEHEQLGSYLESPVAASHRTLDELPTAECPGNVIGPYKLLQQIGEGGMGVVWMAEQTQPVQRTVALKVIKPGMDSRQVITRFEAERQALAMMDHVNIARVFDGGATEAGRPYFVMELVHGVPITKYCDDNQLTPRERLELFVPVCQAIQHAHQKGIIHRDVKPSNVMVTLYDGKPVPKVIDFGVAKATEQKLTERTLFTQYGTMVGTLEYMSPEQAEMSALGVDTRSDIYSLGVLLYELLTGSTPLTSKRMKEAAYAEILRMIKEEEPPKPSTRLSDSGEALASISANRHTEPAKLTKLVRGELDWIVMKCLEKDRNRRYETANGFAADVQSYLNDEPVQACPPTLLYRFRKFARRNKVVLATATTVVVAVVLAVGSLVSAVNVLAASNEQIKEEQKQTNDALKGEQQANEKLVRSLEREARTSYCQSIQLADRELTANNVGRAEELLDESPLHLRGWEWNYLKRRRHAEPIALPLRGRFVVAGGFDLAFSKDGRYVAAPNENEVTVWEITTGKVALTCRGHTGPVRCVVISPDGRRLVSAGEDKTVKVWDMTVAGTGEVATALLQLDGHTARVDGLALSPDGRLLASTSLDRTVRLWDVITGKPLHCFPTCQSRQNRLVKVAFSPDGQRLACGGENDTVKVWEVTTGREVVTLRGHTGPVFSVTFSPDGKLLASLSWDLDVKVWDLTSCQEAFTLHGHSNGVWSLAFSADGQHLAVGGGEADGSVRVCDAATGQIAHTLQGHTGRVISVTYNTDGRRLASAGADKNIKLWDTTTGQEVLTLRGHGDLVTRVTFSPDGHRLVSADGDNKIKVWDATPPEKEADRRFLILRGHTRAVHGVAFSLDSKLLASASWDHTVKVWEVTTGQEVFTLRGHTSPVFQVAFGPDSQHLVSGSHDKTVKLWNVRTGQEVRTLFQCGGGVFGLAISPDGRCLATSDSDQNLQVWDATTGAALHRLTGHLAFIWSVAFSPDSQRLASASIDRTVKVWNVGTGKREHTLTGHTGRVGCVAFSPDGRLLASSDSDQKVKIWDWVAEKEVLTLNGHTHYVFGLAFSPDGRHLASASWGEVLVWNAQTGAKVQTLGGHAGTIWSVAYSPDGRRLAVASGYKGKGEIKIWDATLWENKAIGGR